MSKTLDGIQALLLSIKSFRVEFSDDTARFVTNKNGFPVSNLFIDITRVMNCIIWWVLLEIDLKLGMVIVPSIVTFDCIGKFPFCNFYGNERL